MRKYDFGTQFSTKNSGVCTIIKYVNSYEVYVMFEDGTLVKCSAGNLSSGRVGNPNRATVFGVGVNDIENSTSTKLYQVWHSMLRRCYSDYYRGNKPSYDNVTVQESWLRFSNFKRDIESIQFFDLCEKEDYELDKDLLSGESRIYKIDVVSFLPKEINKALIKDIKFGKYKGYHVDEYGCYKPSTKGGVDAYRKKFGFKTSFKTAEEAVRVYKICKSAQLNYLAEKYKGKIDDRVYDKLKNYKFDLEDSS